VNLRTKLILALIVPLLLLAAGSSWYLHAVVLKSYQELELDDGVASTRRLAQALLAEADELHSIAREWGEWNEMYAYMANHNPKFAAENISPAGIKSAKLAWLITFDLHGKVQDLVARPGAGRPPFEDFEPGQAHYRAWSRMSSSDFQNTEANCDLASDKDGLLLLCRHPITTATAAEPARGVVVLVRRVDAAMLARIASRTQLALRLTPIHLQVLPLLRLSDHFSRFGASAIAYKLEPRTLTLYWSLADLAGVPAAQFVIDVPRLITARGEDVLERTQIQLALLIAAAAGIVLLVLERVVVRPLRRLGGELNDIAAGGDWSRRASAHAPDDIGQLTRLANGLLDVIAKKFEELERIGLIDALTGLANRRAFDQRLEHLVRQHQRNGQPLSLLLIDIDCFKSYNDHFGHPAGDVAMQTLAACLARQSERAGDLACRVGGDEFALVLADTPTSKARLIADTLVRAMQECALAHPYSVAGPILTVSVGVAGFASGDSVAALYGRADAALYRAKHAGRNRVEPASAAPAAQGQDVEPLNTHSG
jgi:diguanylate cyclase (GGDEF)-like protein